MGCGLGLSLLQRARPVSYQDDVNQAVWAAWRQQQKRGSFMMQAADLAVAVGGAAGSLKLTAQVNPSMDMQAMIQTGKSPSSGGNHNLNSHRSLNSMVIGVDKSRK